MGNVDRIIRAIVGAGLIIIGPISNTLHVTLVIQAVLGFIGAFALLSALFSYCIFYDITGSNTLPKPKD